MSNYRPPLEHLSLWDNEKLVTWATSHRNPFIRVPLPSGRYASKTIKFTGDELETFEKCKSVRDNFGIRIWGKNRWNDIMKCRVRTVAKHHTHRSTPRNGVNHVTRRGVCAWVAVWYEAILDSDGKHTGVRKKRSAWFGYGGTQTKYHTSEEAYDAAVKKRIEEETKWYTVTEGKGEQKVNE